MIQALLIMIGGGLGAVVRAWLTDVTKSKWSTSIPIATLIVNWIGSFLIGLTTGLSIHLNWIHMFFITGFLGGLTTFSTMSYELAQCLTPSFKLFKFMMYSLLQFVIGFISCWIGFII